MSEQDYPYPEDEFDVEGASRVPKGVHRAPIPRWKQWIPYLLVLILVPLLTIVVVKFYTTSQGTETPDASPTQVSTPTDGTGEDGTEGVDDPTTTDPEVDTTGGETEPTDDPADQTPDLQRDASVLVLNGARVQGLAGQVAGVLEADGWTNTAADNHDGDTPVATTIYYTSSEFEAEAQAVAETLNIDNVVEDPASASNGIVIVLRAGYTVPIE